MTRAEVMIAREAYRRALNSAGYLDTTAEASARDAYPLPTVEVPREIAVADERVVYRYVGGVFESMHNDDGVWRRSHVFNALSPVEMQAVIGLIDNPTITVEVAA